MEDELDNDYNDEEQESREEDGEGEEEEEDMDDKNSAGSRQGYKDNLNAETQKKLDDVDGYIKTNQHKLALSTLEGLQKERAYKDPVCYTFTISNVIRIYTKRLQNCRRTKNSLFRLLKVFN